MPDADAISKALDKRLVGIYSDALETAMLGKRDFLRKLSRMDELEKALPAGYTEEQRKKWRQGFIQQAIRQEQVIAGISQALSDAGEQAAVTLRDTMTQLYAQDRADTIAQVGGDKLAASFAQYDKRQLSVLLQEHESPFSKLAYDKLNTLSMPQKRLQSALAQATILGESQRQIIERIRAVTGQSLNQARTVAQTERTRVQSQARNQAIGEAAQMGIAVRRKWICKGYHSRPTHRMLHGQIVGADEPFITATGISLMYPGDPSAPAEEVINCHCVLVPVVTGRKRAETQESSAKRKESYTNPKTGLQYQYGYGKLSAGDIVITPPGNEAVFERWKRGTKDQTIAGYGTDTPIDDIKRIVREYKGQADLWIKQKRPGIITLTDEYGNEESVLVDFHWYYEASAGIVERKIKVDEITGTWVLEEI